MTSWVTLEMLQKDFNMITKSPSLDYSWKI